MYQRQMDLLYRHHLVRERGALPIRRLEAALERLSVVATVVAVSGLGVELTFVEGPTDPPAAEVRA